MREILLILTLAILFGCSDSTNAVDNSGSVFGISYGECKINTTETKDSNLTKVIWNYENGNLHIQHINAGFNCCPGSLTATSEIAETTINITEKQAKADCRCNCLYDLSYSIKNIDKKVYDIIIEEPFIYDEDNKIKFRIDLSKNNQGQFSVLRNLYPWGL